MEEQILKILKAVNSGNLKKIQKYCDKKQTTIFVPRVALKCLSGFVDEEPITIQIESTQ